MMSVAEVYGVIPRANTEKRDSAPPENVLKRTRIRPDCGLNSWRMASGLIPGTGICVPGRYTTSARITNTRRCLRSPYFLPLPAFPAACALATLTPFTQRVNHQRLRSLRGHRLLLSAL